MMTSEEKKSIESSIELAWLGRHVKQTLGDPEFVGRSGTVKETAWDEMGALHCLCSCDLIVNSTGEFWCPAYFLSL